VTAVELIHLTKKFKEVVAVKDLSLEIRYGEFLFLLGPSGCGKTTTLRIIGGLEDPTDGIVRIKGQVVNGIPPERRDTATVFQNWALFPHKTIFENVAFGLKMRKRPKKEISEKVEAFLDMVNLSGYASRYPAQLSGGQKQRVALVRALVVEPAVLLLDEPLSALDLKLRQQMRFEIKRIQKRLKVTTIFVTHDQTEAMAMADRIVLMNEGRVEQIGSPQDIYYQPNSKFTSDFIGETNFLEGAIAGLEEKRVLVDLAEGTRLTAPSGEGSPQSGRVLIAVRPENIALKRERTPSSQNILEGRIFDVTFLGATLRFHVEFGGKIVMVDAVGDGRLGKYRQGETVFLEVDPECCLLLPG